MASASENILSEEIRSIWWKGIGIRQALAFVSKKVFRIVHNAFVDKSIFEKCETTKLRHHKKSINHHNLNFPFHP